MMRGQAPQIFFPRTAPVIENSMREHLAVSEAVSVSAKPACALSFLGILHTAYLFFDEHLPV